MQDSPTPKAPNKSVEKTNPQRQLLAETGILYKQFNLTDHAQAAIYQGNRMTEYHLECQGGNRLHWSKGEQGTITANQHTFSLTEANLFFSPHNDQITYHKNPTNKAEVFVLEFDETIIFPLGRRVFTCIDPIFSYIELLKNALLGSSHQTTVRSITHQIELQLHANHFKDQRTSQACDWLTSQLDNPNAASEIPEQLSLSGSQFRRIFKRDLNTSPTHWHIAARLSYAHYLLKGTNLPFQTVAAKCGFASYPTFSRLFKVYYEYSPKSARSR